MNSCTVLQNYFKRSSEYIWYTLNVLAEYVNIVVLIELQIAVAN